MEENKNIFNLNKEQIELVENSKGLKYLKIKKFN
jgi:hypothetical protein